MKDLIAITVGNYTLTGPAQLPGGGVDNVFGMAANLISILLAVVSIITLFSLIYTGIQWTTSGGDEKKLETAKGRFKYSIIGLIVALSSFFIIQFIGNWFGISSPFSNSSPPVSTTCSDLSGICLPNCSGSGRTTIGTFDCRAPNGICCR